MDLVSAQLGGAVSANAASANALSATPSAAAGTGLRTFGLAMRFAVTFSSAGLPKPLGEWSSCKGLKVDFKTEAVKLGGAYDHEVKLPTQVVYAPVVLERAMERQSSADLQAWLGGLAARWMNYASADAPPPRGTVVIVLQDVNQNSVASWTLRDAYPVSWSGPTLDAKGNAIALETLTLEHQGFLPQ